MSVVSNIDKTEFVIKVAGADKPWRRAQAWMGRALGVYDEGDHGTLAAMMLGPDWRDEADPTDG